MSKKQIIVLGIYRSGTSLIGGTLAKLGIDMGRHENLANYYNPSGYYECEDCIAVTSKIRDKCGKVFYNVDSTDIDKVIDDEESNKLVKNYIDSRNKLDIWGVKDPKMVAFFKLFLKYLDNPYIIFIRRNRDSIIKSWSSMKDKEDPTSVEQAHDNHIKMLLEIKELAKERNIPFVEIDYSEHIDNPIESAKKIAEFVGVENNEEAAKFCRYYSLSGKK